MAICTSNSKRSWDNECLSRHSLWAICFNVDVRNHGIIAKNEKNAAIMRILPIIILALFSSCALAEERWDLLVTEANQYLSEGQKHLQMEYKFGEHERFDWYQKSSELIFSDKGVPTVKAKVQFVGSISTKSNTWLWSWANSSLLEQTKTEMSKVKEYGIKYGFPALTTAKWNADEIDGWEMTSITALILKAKGAYRTKTKSGFVYMVITDMEWIKH